MRRRGDARATTLLAVAAAVPALISGARAVAGGWAAVIDNAVIAVRTRDVLTAHPPLVGIYTMLTATSGSHVRLHHPGPLEFWLFAVPVRLGGPEAGGLAVAAAIVNALAAAGLVWVGYRLGGVRVAALGTAVVAVLTWSLGGQVLHDPWNPHLVLLPFMLLLFACASLAAGDVAMLPVVAFLASFMQVYLPFLVLAAIVVAWALVALGVALVRARRGNEDAAGSDESEWVPIRRRAVRYGSIAAAIVVVCWIGPIVDQVAGSGNFGRLLSASTGGGTATVGLSVAWRDLVHATSIPPVWFHPITTVAKADTAPAGWEIATSVLVLAALVALTAHAWSRRARGVATAGVSALVACVAAVVTTASVPVAYRYTQYVYPRRMWWPVGVFVWFVVVYAAGDAIARRLPRRASARSSLLAPAAVGMVALLAAVVATWSRLGPADDYGSGGFGAVRTLAAAASPVVRDSGPWLLRSAGGFAQTVVGPGVASSLISRGRHVVVPDADFPDLGSPHFAGRGARLAGELLVVSGRAADAPGPGFRVVARWDPATAGEPYRHYRGSVLLIPVEPVALYARATARAG